MKYILLLLSMSLAVLGQLFLKKGISIAHLKPELFSIIKTVLSPFVLTGFVLYGVSSIIWLFVLQKLPLSVAYPALALTYIIIVFASYFLLKEPLTMQKIGGTLLILLGVFLIFK